MLALAYDAGTAWRGTALSVLYCLGLGLPFIAVALGVGRSERLLAALRRHRLAISRAGGGVLVAVGLLLVTGVWSRWVASLQGVVGGFETVV